MVVISGRNKVWWPEVFAVRLPLSMYAGWITAAMILNCSYMAKSIGFTDPGANPSQAYPDWGDIGMSEEYWSIIIVWVALLIYTAAAWSERNPMLGGVYLWAGAAILENLVTNKPENEVLIINCAVILGIHGISMATLTSYLIFEELQPWYEPLSFWKGGLIGDVDWYRMFEDLGWLTNILEVFFVGIKPDRVESI